MKLLLSVMIIIMMTGCKANSQSNKPNDPPTPEQPSSSGAFPEWVEVIPEYLHRTDYNGIYEELAPNSWSYKSHMVPHPYEEIPGVYCHFCKKVMTHYLDKAWVKGRQVVYRFDLTVDKWNFIDPPRQIIIWQNWLQVEAGNNNHPISTLILNKWKGLSLGLSGHGWLFDNFLKEPYNPDDPKDKKHLHHAENDDGHKQINVGQTYKIQLHFIDGHKIENGKVILFVDGEWIGYSNNQIRSATNKTTMLWGLYWQGNKNGYNFKIPNKCGAVTGEPDLECKSNQLRIENLTMHEIITND